MDFKFEVLQSLEVDVMGMMKKYSDKIILARD